MVFSSSVFLLVFLPLTLVLYFLMPNRAAKNTILFLISLVFYAWGEPVYIVLMLISVTANWLFGLAMGVAPQKRTKKLILVLNLIVNLAILCFFKYEGFIAENVNFIVGFNLVPDLDLPLPIGISFYTLQALSYIIDLYRGQIEPQRNFLYLGMYIACFPQLVAGPIVRYATIQDQILNRKENLQDFCSGLRLFIVGLAKKVLLANVVAILATKMLGMGGAEIGAVGAWAGLLAFTFQILFDFSGYSDMAIGLGKMFGFKYLRNFNYPYLSKSGTEFWRRWHISLGSFYTDYIYIPLGGNRCSTKRWIFNIFVVWSLTGLWHGAAWNFIIWGLGYGVLLVLEKQFLNDLIQKLPSFFQHLYGILVFMFGWLVFWIEDMGVMGEYFVAMFGAFGLTGSSTMWELTAWEYLPIFLVCAIASTPIVPWVRSKLQQWGRGEWLKGGFLERDLPNKKHLSTEGQCTFDLSGVTDPGKLAALNAVGFLVDLGLVVLLIISVMSVVSGSFNPFIYFRF